MKKKKKVSEIVFNPADYAYMDEISMDGWLWEFERRSDEYKKAYAAAMAGTCPDHDLIFLDCYQYDPLKSWAEVDQAKSVLSRFNPVKAINMKWGNKLPSPGKVYHVKINGNSSFDFDTTEDPEPLPKVDVKIKGSTVTLTYKNSQMQINPLDAVRKVLHNENIVLALVNIKANNSVIHSLLEAQLDYWRKNLKIRPLRKAKTPRKKSTSLNKNAKLWKDYLIAYDLYGKCGHYGIVADILSEHDYSDKYLYSERNVENYHKKAEELIKGKYKTLL